MKTKKWDSGCQVSYVLPCIAKYHMGGYKTRRVRLQTTTTSYAAEVICGEGEEGCAAL